MYDAVGYVGVAVGIALETIVAPSRPRSSCRWPAGRSASRRPTHRSSSRSPACRGTSARPSLLAATVGSVVGALVGLRSSAHGAGGRCSTATAATSPSAPDDLDRADRWFARWGDWAVLPRSHGPAGAHVRQLSRRASAACRSGAFSCSARSARCPGMRRSSTRGFAGRRELPGRSRHAIKPFEIRHLRGRRDRDRRSSSRSGWRGRRQPPADSRRTDTAVDRPDARWHPAGQSNIHRLRGGVKVPTGGRLAYTSQPANRIGHCTDAADLTPGSAGADRADGHSPEGRRRPRTPSRPAEAVVTPRAR